MLLRKVMATQEELDELSKWNPMKEDYDSLWFNSYNNGPGAQLPLECYPNYRAQKGIRYKATSIKLYIDKIPLDLSQGGLENILKKAGCKFSKVVLIEDLRKSSAIIYFENSCEASKALQLINNASPYYFRVTFALPEGSAENKSKIIQEEYTSKLKQAVGMANDFQQTSTPNTSTLSDVTFGVCEFQELASITNGKLFNILNDSNSSCTYCNAANPVEHLHYILSEKVLIDPSVKLPELLTVDFKSCSTCNRQSFELKLCSGCKDTYYCDQDCQQTDWINHSKNCKSSSRKVNSYKVNGYKINVAENGIIKSSTPKLNGSNQSKLLTNGNASIRMPSNGKTVQFKENGEQTPNSSTSSNLSIVNEDSEKLNKQQNQTQVQEINDVTDSGKMQAKLVRTVVNNSAPSTQIVKPKHVIKNIPVVTLSKDKIEKVTVSFGTTPSDFYLLSEETKDKLIFDCLNNEIEETNDVEVINVGDYCAALFDEDKKWYRAEVIKKLDQGKYAVRFIDYGNVSVVSMNQIKQLPQKFYRAEAQAMHCMMSIRPSNGMKWTENQIQLFEEACSREILYALYKGEINGDVHVVDLYFDENMKASVGDFIFKKYTEKSISQESNSSQQLIESLPAPQIPIGGKMSVMVLYQEPEQPDTFYFAKDGGKLEYLIQESVKLTAAFKTSIQPEIGSIYLVKSSDGDWYRALCLEKEGQNYKVYYVDFGNCEVVQPNIIELPDYLKIDSVAPNAVKCKIATSDSHKDDWADKIHGAADGSYLLNIIPKEYVGNTYLVHLSNV